MATKKRSDPSYCLHKPSGRAYVTLPDPVTGRRQVVYLGEHGTAASHAEHARVVEAWKEHGRVVDARPSGGAKTPATQVGQTVGRVMIVYWRSVQKRYCIKDGDKKIPSNASKIKQALKRCRRYAGTVPANEFGADDLEVVRNGMVAEGLNREYINDLITKIQRAFMWASQKRMVPASTWHDLALLDRLQYGEQGVKEPGEAEAVPWGHVDAVLPHLTPQVAAIADLMRHTGMGPGEAVQMTLAMIDTTKTTSWYFPEHHKTKHKGKARRIPLGPHARGIVRQFMVGRAIDRPLFSPGEADKWVRDKHEAERKTPKNQGNTRGSNVKDQPGLKPGEQYQVASVTRAIKRACKLAGVPEWTAKQCRNAAAKVLLEEFGPEHVVLALGHSGYALVERYAGRDYAKAEAAIEKIG
ncbi:MAG: tyrosine-type recombinase/integrase [Phycisphaeraceae bacterium]|nr:tyrosine-type recombinase/integrase [Phycisphaeraceae bacterium]